MTMLALRGYQSEAVEAVRRRWHEGVRRPAMVLPTGAGKTVVFAHLAKIMHERGVRSLILAHRDELIGQAVAKLHAVAPDLSVGVVKAERREINADVIVASVQTLARPDRRAELAEAGVRLVIVDEAHHAVADSYMAVLRDLGCFEDDPLQGAYALGVTATLGRSDRVALGQVWQEVAYRRDIIDMIRQGYLVNAKGIRVRIDGLDLSQVARSRGDWRDGALGEAMGAALAPKAVARAYIEHALDRQGIVFWPTVELAYEGAEAFREAGITCEGVDGAMPIEERRRVLAGFARGDIQVVSNCMILTEGFDAPWCSAVVIARPTSSTPLYVQMAGRALRPHPGKQDALIIDVVGVTGRHRLASVVDLVGADRVEKLPDDLAAYEEDETLDLLGLADEGEARAREVEHVDGPLAHEIVDLFGTSRQAWLRTDRGVWFLSVADKLIFLAPASSAEVGLYSVGRVASKTGQGNGEWLREGVDLSMAMSWGEQFAQEGAVLVRKGARWRALAPSEGQLAGARRMGLLTDGLSRGELADAISNRIATWRLDSMPCVRNVTQGGYW